MQQVLISLSSFGAAEVRRHGQLHFARLAREAGADGFEVRGELLSDAAGELPALAQAGAGCALVYSSAEGLWDAAGALDRAALQRALEATRMLGAARLKMAIGGFRPDAAASFGPLARALEDSGIELLIENDQTASAGTLPALQGFLAAAARAGLPLAMTFDMGNWHWTGECPLQAAAAVAAAVRYVHCKGVQRQPAKWVAVPLADSAAPWRAVLRTLPCGLPWAIEYPLAGDDLLAVTRDEIRQLRAAACALGVGR
jgi:sugar phosphate isomerase/epimerase